MTVKITSKELLVALRNKFRDAAVLAEVTMDDESELERVRTAHVKRYPYMRAQYDKDGLLCDAELPDGYKAKDAITRRRIDALIFETKTRTAVEIKISRADFFRDTELKRGAWLKHTHRFALAKPRKGWSSRRKFQMVAVYGSMRTESSLLPSEPRLTRMPRNSLRP